MAVRIRIVMVVAKIMPYSMRRALEEMSLHCNCTIMATQYGMDTHVPPEATEEPPSATTGRVSDVAKSFKDSKVVLRMGSIVSRARRVRSLAVTRAVANLCEHDQLVVLLMEASTELQVLAPGKHFAAQVRTVHVVVSVDSDDIYCIPTELVELSLSANEAQLGSGWKGINIINAVISPPLHLFLVPVNRCHSQQPMISHARLGHHIPPVLFLFVRAVQLGVHREHLYPLCLS